MRVAIVDDENIFRMQLRMMIEKISAKKGLLMDIDQYRNGPDFITALKDKKYDIVFMDIFMPDMDGIETAKELRRMTEKTFLIFMTASDGHYPDAFSLHAFDYVTKPFTIERINQVMREIVEHTPLDKTYIEITVGTLLERVYLKDIVAVTTDGHYLRIRKQDGDVMKVRLTSGEFLDMVSSDDRFAVVNRGIIINMDFIDHIKGGQVYIGENDFYPIASRKLADITQLIKDYKFSV